ncbi:membrane dipeptidase (peptidase family M19) [Mucilaginibacter gracilis]|uniref:Membrane dipeptidase (Peptidase family M19) n=1 Tax=Mucilaginibacter gracilis TaxID=423350 RepID=A0A495J5L1_9SPHI|nr:membrane dipeptidase [Mucilaginibacter gracilis]RKR84043.1 membrane dipeptidase (peptidase family M19) [Mucilaginibacter gracilis]
MQFFDLHCHPGLKTLFRPQDGTQFSAWETLGAARVFGDILSSQCSLQQITLRRQVPLICMTLHPPESGMLDQFIIRAGASVLFRQLMDVHRLQEMYSGADGYQSVFAEELANLTALPRPADNISAQVAVKFLKHWGDFRPQDTGTVHAVFNIEGGHALYSHADQPGTVKEATDNLDAFLALGYLILYLTPTHLTPNQFINHAYGNKILTKGPLLPRGMGITPDGMALIRHVYARGLLIDVKHMSLLSRLQFYRLHALHFPDRPIIASHAGLVGYYAFNEPGDAFLGWAVNEVVTADYVELKGVNNRGLMVGTSFYPLSINLFNEDIVAILKSGGMIGISMDVRILGGKDNDQALQHDYLSPAEYAVLKLPDAEREKKIAELADNLWAGAAPAAETVPADQAVWQPVVETESAELFTASVPTAVGPLLTEHARLIANHLLQIHFVADISGLPLPWQQVCIGSDFDGLIEAVDCCKNITALDRMATALVDALKSGAAEREIDLGMASADIVSAFCYGNAVTFLERHFTG